MLTDADTDVESSLFYVTAQIQAVSTFSEADGRRL